MLRKVLALGFVLAVIGAVQAMAAWRMEIESKTVSPGQTGVTVDFTFAWEVGIQAFTLPVIVRSLEGGAFWTGSLPCDTTDNDGNRYTNGVMWNPIIPPYARFMEMRPSQGNVSLLFTCNSDVDSARYDGVPPDFFAIIADGINPLAARPSGIVFVTLTFGVMSIPGQFEFDTACFTSSLYKIFMIDQNYVDHGPPPNGTNEVVFTKGVITISGTSVCDCSHQGDCDDNGMINPPDIIFMINYALRMTGPPPPGDAACPAINRGDWNCDGKIDLTDIIKMVNYVYRYPAPGPCDPCAP